ncbi:MAG: flagellar biosynthetic protein FliR [Bdellovibrionaceae bacterium]|nr:flagellar biosynthetic protein FliR [Pseudobdellovibrionaceae bacterium]MBX3034373.1 flagellar biosynthetic protein FliR [Pseudobdellovibrionaceae bacterium]
MIGFVFSAALFSLPAINTPLKILFCLVLTMTVYPAVKTDPAVMRGFGEDLILIAGREVLIGLVLGYLTRLFFFAISMTGDLISVTLGLSSAQLYNPMMASQGSVIEQFHVLIGSMFFLLINGHHMLISALVQSLDMIPVGLLSLNTGSLAEVAMFGQDLLVLTIKMSAPVMAAILIANLAMGILGRAIPQINVLVTSFPVTIMLGLVVMFICMPLFALEMNVLVDMTSAKLLQVLKTL